MKQTEQMTKSIVFDARLAHHPGIGRYMQSLLKEMIFRESNYHYTLLGNSKVLGVYEKFQNVTVRPCDVPIYSLKEQWHMDDFYEGADLIHVPHFNIPQKVKAPLIVTIHDFIYFHVKQYRPFPGALMFLKMKMKQIAREAAAIIAVSQATKDECEQRFPQMKGKVRVIHEAADPRFQMKPETDEVSARNTFMLKRPYILSVGSIREHKNTHRLLDAFEEMQRVLGADADLVLVGKVDGRFEAKHHFSRRIRNNEHIRFLGVLSDKDLRGLYREATCYVMPSLYEGFGLPVLEAMASGTPVIISNIPALREIAGDAALVFEPDQIDDLSKLLYNVLTGNDLQQKLRTKGILQSSQFSWNRTAIQTLECYRECL